MEMTEWELDEQIEKARAELEALYAQAREMHWRVNELGRQRNLLRLAEARRRIESGDYSLWIRRKGKVIPIVKMDQQHLLNTIAMLERGRRRRQDEGDLSLAEEVREVDRAGWLCFMKAEVERRQAEGLWRTT